MTSSSTTTTSETSVRTISNGIVPAIGAARPSAVVLIRSSRTGLPASSARRIPAAPEGSIPTTRAPERFAATATEMPAMSPPPPTPTTNRSASRVDEETSRWAAMGPVISVSCSRGGVRKVRPSPSASYVRHAVGPASGRSDRSSHRNSLVQRVRARGHSCSARGTKRSVSASCSRRMAFVPGVSTMVSTWSSGSGWSRSTTASARRWAGSAP